MWRFIECHHCWGTSEKALLVPSENACAQWISLHLASLGCPSCMLLWSKDNLSISVHNSTRNTTLLPIHQQKISETLQRHQDSCLVPNCILLIYYSCCSRSASDLLIFFWQTSPPHVSSAFLTSKTWPMATVVSSKRSMSIPSPPQYQITVLTADATEENARRISGLSNFAKVGLERGRNLIIVAKPVSQ